LYFKGAIIEETMVTTSSRKGSMRKYDVILVVGCVVAVILIATIVILVVLIWRKYGRDGGKNAFQNLAHMFFFYFLYSQHDAQMYDHF
jgi:cytochrome b subunit of formate dehydrogenase